MSRPAAVPFCLALLALALPAARAADSALELPKPKVSINVSSSLLGSFFGVTDAALEGVVTAMRGHKGSSDAVPMTAEQLSAVKTVVSLAQDALQGVRIQVYEGADPALFTGLSERHEASLDSNAGWEQVIAVDEDNERVRIALRNTDGAIRNARILAVNGSETVVVDADCDVSPERAREMAEAVTKIALDLGLEKQLEKAIQEIRAKGGLAQK